MHNSQTQLEESKIKAPFIFQKNALYAILTFYLVHKLKQSGELHVAN